jgi:hypothetical protein
MRVSTDKDDEGYRQFVAAQANGKTIRVFLGGAEVLKCITADDELGFVVRNVVDASGNSQLDPIDPTHIWTERVLGNVEIKFE